MAFSPRTSSSPPQALACNQYQGQEQALLLPPAPPLSPLSPRSSLSLSLPLQQPLRAGQCPHWER